MFGSRQTGVRAYATVGVETGAAAASPHQLIVMLYDGALAAVVSAIKHMNDNDYAKKGEAVSKAILIITDGLRASLDKRGGGDIAASLDSLYEYMADCLLKGSLHNEVARLEEVRQLLLDLRASWNAISGAPQQAAAPAAGYQPRSPLSFAAA